MSARKTDGGISSGALATRLVLCAVGMFAFGYALVPLYDVFCEITGFGGRTNETPATVAAAADTSRTIDLEFVTTVNQYAPWEFRATVDRMSVNPGGLYEATFIATNLADRQMTAQAVPSVAPQQASKYFKKLDCFCFTTQEFRARESRELPVRFVVDPELPEYVDTITLSYTFFGVASLTHNAAEAHSPTSAE